MPACAIVRALLRAATIAALTTGAAADPVPVNLGVAELAAAGALIDPDGLRRLSLAFPPAPPARLLLQARRDDSAAGELLAALRRRGAAGNHGDLYDNRDRGHSRIDPTRHPGLSVTSYDVASMTAGLDLGLNDRLMLQGAVVIGNSSTAITGGALWRSLPRLAMSERGAMERVAALHAANHFYVYPSHQDVGGRHGDVMPAATAQMMVSLGSSGSDRRFIDAAASALAALPPETKALMVREGLAASTLQLILRRTMAGVESDADYLSPAAHPTAFPPAMVRRQAAIRLAAAMEVDALPPAMQLRVIEETLFPPGLGLLGDGLSEALFDTAGGVARIALGVVGLRRYRLDVGGTRDPNGRALRFHWRVLRGAGAAVTPLDADGAAAEVTLRWPSALSEDSRRVDIAVFADNGAQLSAPAFFSIIYPLRQRQVHAPDGRPLSIDYAPAEAGGYDDPALFVGRAWRDDYAYDAAGRLIGWNRTRRDGSTDAFTRHGLRIVERDTRGRATRAEQIRYEVMAVRRGPEGAPAGRAVREMPDERFWRYVYADPADAFGALEAAPAR